MLDNILPVALEGSVILQEALRRPAESLAAARLGTNLNLFDPEDIDTQKARNEALRYLKAMPDMGEVLRDVAKTRAELTAPIPAVQWKWVAWMYKDDDSQKWVCAAPSAPPSGASDLYIATSRGTSFAFVKIGAVQDNEYTFTGAPATTALIEGRPVFFRQ